jgi:hypothetical protein
MKLFLLFGVLLSFANCLPDENAADQDGGTKSTLNKADDPLNEKLPFGTYSLPDPNGEQMQALVGGNLKLTDGCLYLEGNGINHIAVFPAEHTSWEPATNEILILGTRLTLGSFIRTNGGYINRNSESEKSLLDPIPKSCVGSEFIVVGTETWVR